MGFFLGSLFSKGIIIGGNFAPQNGLEKQLKTLRQLKGKISWFGACA